MEYSFFMWPIIGEIVRNNNISLRLSVQVASSLSVHPVIRQSFYTFVFFSSICNLYGLRSFVGMIAFHFFVCLSQNFHVHLFERFSICLYNLSVRCDFLRKLYKLQICIIAYNKKYFNLKHIDLILILFTKDKINKNVWPAPGGWKSCWGVGAGKRSNFHFNSFHPYLKYAPHTFLRKETPPP